MSPLRMWIQSRIRCFPRVSGDEPFPWDQYMDLVKFSPRERG